MTSLEYLLKIQDINLYLNKFLDVNSLRNLSIATKINYNNYIINKIYIDKQNIKKIFSHFNLSEYSLIKPLNNLSNDEILILNKQLNNLYNHFNKKKYCHISDFLNYLTERNYPTTILFETFVSMCKFKPNITRNTENIENTENTFDFDTLLNEFLDIGIINNSISRHIITTTDIQYILKYCNLKEFDIILSWYKIPPSLLSFIIKDLLFNEKILKHVDKKIMKIIDYFLYNYCSFDFTNNSYLYFDIIMGELISHKKISLFMYILEKRKEYGFELSYQLLINKTLEYRNLQILKIIITIIKEDNKKLENKIQITISPDLIFTISSHGSFQLLEYVVTKMLGRMINIKRYISCLCDGISSFYINKNKEINIDRIRNNINWLNEWLTDENKQFLNMHLSFI